MKNIDRIIKEVKRRELKQRRKQEYDISDLTNRIRKQGIIKLAY